MPSASAKIGDQSCLIKKSKLLFGTNAVVFD